MNKKRGYKTESSKECSDWLFMNKDWSSTEKEKESRLSYEESVFEEVMNCMQKEIKRKWDGNKTRRRQGPRFTQEEVKTAEEMNEFGNSWRRRW